MQDVCRAPASRDGRGSLGDGEIEQEKEPQRAAPVGIWQSASATAPTRDSRPCSRHRDSFTLAKHLGLGALADAVCTHNALCSNQHARHGAVIRLSKLQRTALKLFII